MKLKIRKGLTLLELSLVIFAFSILLLVMFSFFLSTSDLTREFAPESQERQKAMLALELLRSSISRAYFMPNAERLVFVSKRGSGDQLRRDRITFASYRPGSESTGQGGVHEISFYVKDAKSAGDEDGTLMCREDEHVDDKPGEGGKHYPVLTNVVSLVLKHSLNGSNWQEDWSTKKTKKLPLLVRIELRVRIGGKIHLYESVASPGK